MREIDISFRSFLAMDEATLSPKRSKELSKEYGVPDAQHRVRMSYLGWDIWFYNRNAVEHKASKDREGLEDWLYDGETDRFAAAYQQAWKPNSEWRTWEKEFHDDWNEEEDEEDYLNDLRIFKKIEKGLIPKDKIRGELEEFVDKTVNERIGLLFAGGVRGSSDWVKKALKGNSPWSGKFHFYISQRGIEEGLADGTLFNKVYDEIQENYDRFIKQFKAVLPYLVDGYDLINRVMSELHYIEWGIGKHLIANIEKAYGRGNLRLGDRLEIKVSEDKYDLLEEVGRHENLDEYVMYYIDDKVRRAFDKIRYNEKGKDYDEDNFYRFMRDAFDVTKRVVGVLQSFNLRSFHRVPIIFCYQDWNEPSGYGNSYKFAHASYDSIVVFANHDNTADELLKTLAHEAGHIVFGKLSYEEQAEVKKIAYLGTYTRDYGKPTYVYSGLKEPVENHTSGNEFFATMVEYFAKYYGMYLNKVPKLSDFAHIEDFHTPKTKEDLTKHLEAIKRMRRVLAGATNTTDPRVYATPPSNKIRPPRRIKPRFVAKKDRYR